MTIHTKTALILLVTIVLGVMIGLLISANVVRHRPFPKPPFPLSESFVDRFEHLIDPGESQSDTVRAMLKTYSERFSRMNESHRDQMISLFDSMHADLSTVLTDEQKDRLQKDFERHRSMGPPPEFPMRPPPGFDAHKEDYEK
jgi:hypothetical protein